MPKLSQDAIHELRQSLPLIERCYKIFSEGQQHSKQEYHQVKRVYDRVSELASPTQVETWVGPPFEVFERETYSFSLVRMLWTALGLGEQYRNRQRSLFWIEGAERLYLYVKEILQTEEVEEMLNRLAQENASLKEQLAELRRRESTYLSIVKEAQTSATYSPSPKDREILLESHRRQRTILIKNLTRYQEDKAKYGLNVPVNILNAIDQTQQDLKQIEATIADLETGKTDTNRKP